MTTRYTSSQIRQQYIDFFVQKHAHVFVPSSPVVPHNDPTLLFTNAGMNQFKPYFLGTEQAPWKRVANTQKCIRAGGKHNDLDDVGRSRRHHTFFEMLGNWSFGDYFKKGAIEMAWELLTKTWGLDPKRLHVSCYEGSDSVPRDTEAADIWRKVANWEQYGLKSDDHIHYFGKDNFWEMGDTGPCGPCTEIYIDRRPQSEIDADLKSGKRSPVNGEDPRVMEIWNNVFIQYNRDNTGKLTTLSAQHVDTGMGLERICQVLQDKNDNFAIDLWDPIFAKISELSGHKYTGLFTATNSVDPVAEAANPQLRSDIAFRVIADHARCLTFALTDGAVPSNEGRGYVLRRILRRAVRFGRQQLGLHKPFVSELVPVIVATMGDTFPELRKNSNHVISLIRDEEESFGKTLDRGIALFEGVVSALGELKQDHIGGLDIPTPDRIAFAEYQWDRFSKDPTTRSRKALDTDKDLFARRLYEKAENFERRTGVRLSVESMISCVQQVHLIPAEAAFKLHDTFGFPIDLTCIMAAERGMTVDIAGFEKLMEEAKELARSGGADNAEAAAQDSLVTLVQNEKLSSTNFLGYETTEIANVDISLRTFELREGEYKAPQGASIATGSKVALVLDRTTFYALSGGQVGDTGVIQIVGGARVNIEDTVKVGETWFHLGKVTAGSLPANGTVKAALAVDKDRRAKIASNHTTTHVMNHKLRAVLGDHIQQKGSLVDQEKLRFDFSHGAAVSTEHIDQIEQMVNADISKDLPVYIEYAPQELALKIHGLRAVFGEKYPPKVRVVSVGVPVKELLASPDKTDWYNVSVEFCGGTHLAKTGDAEGFAVVSEEAVGKGLRRLTALTGAAAHRATAEADRLLGRVNALKNAAPEALVNAIAELTTTLSHSTLPLIQRHKLREGLKELQEIVKQHDKARAKEAAGQAVESARKIAEAVAVDEKILVVEIPGADSDGLKSAIEVMRKKLPNTAVLIGGVPAGSTDKIFFLASVPEAQIKAGLKAGDWVKEAAKIAGGGGGGKPDVAQAGGKDPSKLAAALAAAKAFAQSKC